MKTIFIVSALLFIAVEADVAAEQNKFYKAVEACEKAHGEPKNLYPKLLKGEDIGDEQKASVMAFCVNHKMGLINGDGEVIMENYKDHTKIMVTDENKFNDLISNCCTKNGTTPEGAALNFVRCVTKRLSKN